MFGRRFRILSVMLMGWSSGVTGCYNTRSVNLARPTGSTITIRFLQPRSVILAPESADTSSKYRRTVNGVLAISGRVLRSQGDTVVLQVRATSTGRLWIQSYGDAITRIDVSQPNAYATASELSAVRTAGFILLIPVAAIVGFLAIFMRCSGTCA